MAKDITYNEILFNFVRDNPGLTAVQIETLVPHVSKGSVTSLLSSMAKRHLIIKSGGVGDQNYGGVFHAAVDKYMSPAEQLGVGRGKRMSNPVKAKSKKASAKKQMDQLDTSTPALEPLKPFPAPAPKMRSVFDLDVESLTIAEARALRDKLNALFGG